MESAVFGTNTLLRSTLYTAIFQRGLRKRVTLRYDHMQSKAWKNGWKYYGFTYYPRFPEQKDPEYDPSPLFMVRRVKPYLGNPWYYKQIMKDLGLDQKTSDISILVNCEQINKRLWSIKHLIQILPVTFPDGYPKEEDFKYGHLNHLGEFRIIKDITPEKRLEAYEEYKAEPRLMNNGTLKRRSRLKWQNPIE